MLQLFLSIDLHKCRQSSCS